MDTYSVNVASADSVDGDSVAVGGDRPAPRRGRPALNPDMPPPGTAAYNRERYRRIREGSWVWGSPKHR